MRIGKKEQHSLYSSGTVPRIGTGAFLREGSDFLLIGCGPILLEACRASDELREKDGIYLSVYSMPTIKPLDHNFLQSALEKKYKAWFVLEEHSSIGGLGNSIIAYLNNTKAPHIVQIALPDIFLNELGNQDYMRTKYGLDSDSIVERIRKF